MNKRVVRFLWISCLLSICSIGIQECRKIVISGISVTAKAQATEDSAVIKSQKAEQIKAKKLSVEVTYGVDKWAKYGRYMNVDSEITNASKNFNGKLQIIIPKNNNENIMYQKDVNLAEGETKEISLCIPILSRSDANKINLMVVDKNKDIILQKNLKVNVSNGNDLIYVGALTDNFNNLNYLAINQKTKLFSLSEKNIPTDYLGLDVLDIIVIDNYNTDKLSKEQYEAIKKWVSNGGTLVIGTGVNANKTLQIFQDDFLIGRKGNISKKQISLDAKENNDSDYVVRSEKEAIDMQTEETTLETIDEVSKLTKDVLEIDIKNARTILTVQNTPILQSIEYNSGNIQVFGFDLGLEYKSWETVGKQIFTVINNGLSQTKKIQLQNEINGENSSSILQTLSINGKENIPKVTKYIIILFIYMVCIGPVLYFILKKKDKREWTWIIVPIFSVIFALIVYGSGSTTRITKPFVNYISLLKLDKSGNGIDELYFSLVAPFNMKYNIGIDPKYNIQVLENDRYSYYLEENHDLKSYKTAFKYSADKTTIEIKDKAAFSPVNFVSKDTTQIDGNWESNINYNNYKFTGTFTNHLESDIENAIIIGNGEIVNLGNIKSEETVQLDDKKDSLLVTQDDLFNEDDMISKIVGGERYDNRADVNIRRKYAAMDYYLRNMISKGLFTDPESSNYLVGFVKMNKKGTLIKEMGLKSNGIRMIVVPLSVNYTKDNITIIPSIDSYVVGQNNYYNNGYRYINEEQVRLEYQLPADEKILSIVYSSELNKEFKKNTISGYYGTISAYNYVTGDYDKWFESGIEGEITELGNYLDKDNKLLLSYDADKKALDNLVSFPIISVKKEAN